MYSTLAELFPEPLDVRIHRPSLDVGRIPPHPFEKRVPGLDAARAARQIQKQPKFERGQENFFSLDFDPMRGNVDDEIAQRDHLRAFNLGGGNRSPKDRLYSQHELPRTERLGHVVVSAHLEANYAIDLVASGSQHDHRQAHRLGVPPEAPTYFEARNVRQHDIEHEQIRLAPLDLGQCSVAVVGDGDVVTGPAQVERDQFGKVRLVFYD